MARTDYTRTLLRLGLYPHARWLRPLLEWLRPDYFGTDVDFIRSVGLMRSRRDFSGEAADFHNAQGTHGILHRQLRLRVSAERVRRVVDRAWGED